MPTSRLGRKGGDDEAVSGTVAGRHMDLRYRQRQPWFDPRLWTGRTWATVLVVLAIIAGLLTAAGIIIPKELKNYGLNFYPAKDFHLEVEYYGKSFFDGFQYWEGDDRTNGHVIWSSRDRASELNLTVASSESAILKVDTSLARTPNGRPSARVVADVNLESALVIIDILHAPYGCGIWPAIRLTSSPSRPTIPLGKSEGKGFELDLLEARQMIPANVNNDDDDDDDDDDKASREGNVTSTETAETTAAGLVYEAATSNVTLYTNSHCHAGDKRHQTGVRLSDDCQLRGQGCAVGDETFFRQGFGDGDGGGGGGGGVLVADIRPEGARVWHFERGAVPGDALGYSPRPQKWDPPVAEFPNLMCDMSSLWRDWAVVLDINLCGKPPSAEEIQVGGCGKSSCKEFVSNNPKALLNAYWEIAFVRIFSPRDVKDGPDGWVPTWSVHD